ncbi:MAG TPA: ribosome-associated translation inhibitor RaiA [Thermoanaerobaculia bacterium]|nr:ribosome-associated translation inhibitor RaiA [Thermoanaerobaculia bacterium]
MNIEYVARNTHLDDDIRAYAEDKIGKIAKFLEEPVEIRVTLETEKHLTVADLHVFHRFGELKAREATENALDAINVAVDKIGKQARRSRKKFMDKRRRADRQDGHQWPLAVVEGKSLEAGQTPRIIRNSYLRIKPMTIEEAALELEESKNDFFVFRDSTNDRISVLYRRRDENFGLISPEP